MTMKTRSDAIPIGIRLSKGLGYSVGAEQEGCETSRLPDSDCCVDSIAKFQRTLPDEERMRKIAS